MEIKKIKCPDCGKMFVEKDIRRCIFLGLEFIVCKECFRKGLKII